MNPIPLIVLVFAFVLAALASFNISHPKFNFGWGSIALWFLYLILGGFFK
jgi:hypothetical protein